MTSPPITPLDAWVRARIGQDGPGPLDIRALRSFQSARLRETLEYARRKSAFYKDRFSSYRPFTLSGPDDLERIPFTSASDLRRDPFSFLCVSQDEVARVFTLQTSGTTHAPKRLFFTEQDLEATVDFFCHGMAASAGPGDRVMILLPCNTPESAGDLLARAVERLGATPIRHGPVSDVKKTAAAAIETGATCMVGIPVQVLALARHPAGSGIAPGAIRSVMLTGDFVPRAMVSALKKAWGCRVFEHWGMTETGFGGAVSCASLDGCHLREPDLYFEIIDPLTGRPVTGEEPGELVFTTLDRQAMPLIRFRTGDRARWLCAPCPCGSALRRIAPVMGRTDNDILLDNGRRLCPGDIDEALFSIDTVLDYRARVREDGGKARLAVRVCIADPARAPDPDFVRRAVTSAGSVKSAMENGVLSVDPVSVETGGTWTRGWTKRTIEDMR